MLNEVFSNLIGNAIVASGRAIKVHNIEMYTQNGFEITPEQYLVLNMLKKESYSQARLCDLLMKDKSNMARIISVLEAKNLIQKRQQTENGKQINKISLLEQGEVLCSKITPVMNESRKKYLRDITEDEMYTCIKVLGKIQKNLEKE